ncbi:WD40-repeat-containing domain protein [Phyllosticta citriasiana]|uniref:WD40-repeat-containing domain protein n=1 Tax=Phyllosticta citriasiana TaxID=595635 RepID=UPI0030FD4FF3
MSKPPPTPSYILRGHAATVHAVRFIRRNSRLLTADADGWLVLWNLASKRPAAVWRPHSATILGLDADQDRIITHGRDSHLRVWQLRVEDEAALSTVLPVDDADAHRKQPWLLHSIPVNTLNFCSFATCQISTNEENDDSTLVAVPGVLDGQIAVYALPSERRFSTVPKTELQTGMVMALALVPGAQLRLIAGYESGLAVVFAHDAANDSWTRIYASTPHTQPLLSLSPLPSLPGEPLTYFSSGADDVVAKHIVSPPPSKPTSAPAPTPNPPKSKPNPPSLLSSALSSSSSSPFNSHSIPKPNPVPAAPCAAAQVIKTKHAGQQSLAVRADGRLLATAGWDGRVRVYSTRTLREMAVLKWHAEGCYAVSFGNVVDRDSNDGDEDERGEHGQGKGALARVRRRREDRVRDVHWVAAGSKDGKVSLWEVF